MATHNQTLKGIRKPKKSKNPVHLLKGCPQRQVVCVRVFEMTPRKPNSAKRKVARVRFKNLIKNKRMLTAYIPGLGHKLQEHAAVMVCGGGAKDLPGINYRLIRGKYDFGLERYARANRRSKYGAKKE